MSKDTARYYPNSLCFKNKNEAIVNGNWFDLKYQNVHLAIEECKGSSASGQPCKQRHEIASFMK